MKNSFAFLGLIALLLISNLTPVMAQPVRNGVDVIWARDIEGSTLTLDGQLTEPEWMSAETLQFRWNENMGFPGSGQKIEGQPALAEPSDPHDAMVYILRDGNTLWLGMMAQDQSVGGGLSLWNFDGIIMSIFDRSQRPDTVNQNNNFFANGAHSEFFYTWWNPADTTDTGDPTPGIEARLFGDYGVGFNEGNSGDRGGARNPDVWDARATVDGVVNDDSHGNDNGYTMEMRIDLGAMGYDFSQADGDVVPFNIAVQDDDFSWPENPDTSFLSRVWWQNQWGNNFNEGVAYMHGNDAVTISSGDAPEVTQPEFTVPSIGGFDAPTIDGALDEDMWAASAPIFNFGYQASNADLMEGNPGALAPYHVSWFDPDINGDGRAAAVVDNNPGRFHMAFEGNTLFIGLDTDDQAVSGFTSEGGRDGFRITMARMDTMANDGSTLNKQFDFLIDSTGVVQGSNDAFDALADGSIVAGASLKGTSTVADPTDVDEGYQIEVAIDLVQALGYASSAGKVDDPRIWIALNFFDGDFFEDAAASYANRTWIVGERGDGASLYGYLNSETAVANEAETELPASIRLLGNYPNPFNPSTRIQYVLPQAGNVTLELFDVLGRNLMTLNPGLQSAGEQVFTFEANGLASGTYLYRIAVETVSGNVSRSQVGRMILLK